MSFYNHNRARITPGLVHELTPIGLESIVSYLQESLDAASPDQIEVALLTGLTAFLSTLRNGGHYDDARRAAISGSKSVSHAVDGANIYSDRFQNPKKKTLSTIKTASGLIKRAVLTSLPRLPEHKKRQIGSDVEGVINLFTLIPKHSSTKGSGLFGGGIGGFENNLNTEWLNPNDNDTIEGGWNPFSWFSSKSTTDNVDTGVTPADADPYAQSSIYDDPTLQTPIDADPTLMSTDDDAPKQPSTGFWTKLGSGALALGLGAAGLFTGNPLLQKLAIQAAIPVATAVAPVVFKGLHMVGDATYGRFRRWIKKKDWSDTNRTGFFGRMGHKVARGLKTVYKWNDKQIDAATQWYKDHKMQDDVKKLGKTIGVIAPAVGEDYLNYKQKMAAYQQQQKQAKAQLAYQQKKEKEEVDRQNAILKAQNAKERQEALMYNSQKMGEFANEQEFYDALTQYDDDLHQLKRDYQEALRDYERDQNKAKREEQTIAAQHESRSAWLNTAVNAATTALEGFAAYKTIAGFAESGSIVGLPAGLASFALAGLSHGAAKVLESFTSAKDHGHLALQYSDQAAAAEARGDYELAQRLNDAATKEADIARDRMSLALDEQAKFEKERNAAKKDAIKNVVDGVGKTLHSLNDAYSASQRAEQIANRSIEPKPTDESLFISAPRKKPNMPLLKYVPDEMTDDDPRLKKFVEREYVEAPIPMDVYATPHTTRAVNTILPYVLAGKPPPKEETITSLPYVNPLPVFHVDPASGARNTLRTKPVMIQKSSGLVRPTPMMGNSLNTLQPQKRGRKF